MCDYEIRYHVLCNLGQYELIEAWNGCPFSKKLIVLTVLCTSPCLFPAENRRLSDKYKARLLL